MLRREADFAKEFASIDGVVRHTLALLGTTDPREGMSLLLRYQSSARRSYAAAMRALRELQGDRFNRQPAAAPLPHPLAPLAGKASANTERNPEPPAARPSLSARNHGSAVALRRP